MADPLSVAPGAIALSGFALQASKLLYQTIASFRNSKQPARELREEVQALSQALETLKYMAVKYKVELSVLRYLYYNMTLPARS